MPLDLTPEQCARLNNLYLKTDLGIVDRVSEVLGVGDFVTVLHQSITLELPAGS